MLGLVIVTLWSTFVCAYLVWQQLIGDLAEEADARPSSAIRS